MKHRIRKLVEHLRAKPEKERERIALSTTAVIGALLVLLWVAAFTSQNDAPTPKKEVFGENVVRPFELLKQNFNNTVDTVSQGVSGIRKDFQSVKQEASSDADKDAVTGADPIVE